MYVEQNRNFMENSGLFLNMAKWCFGVSFFEVLMLLWCLFGVSGIVPKVFKMLVLPSFGGFCGVGYFCLFGFRRFRCFGVLVFVFLFFVLVLFLFCLLCFCLVVGLFLVLVLVLFLFFVYLLLFFVCFLFLLEGLRVR